MPAGVVAGMVNGCCVPAAIHQAWAPTGADIAALPAEGMNMGNHLAAARPRRLGQAALAVEAGRLRQA